MLVNKLSSKIMAGPDKDRQTGKTTAAILQALGAAIDKPGRRFYVADPDITSVHRGLDVGRRIDAIVQNLGLKHIYVSVTAQGVGIESNHIKEIEEPTFVNVDKLLGTRPDVVTINGEKYVRACLVSI
jgi:hypothetical protein